MTNKTNIDGKSILRQNVDELLSANNMSTDFDSYSKYFSPTVLKVVNDSIDIDNKAWVKSLTDNTIYREGMNVNEKVTFSFSPIKELVDKEIVGVKLLVDAYATFDNATVYTLNITNTSNDNGVGKFLKVVFDSKTLIEHNLCKSDIGDIRFDLNNIALDYQLDASTINSNETIVYVKLPYIQPNQTIGVRMTFDGIDSTLSSRSLDTSIEKTMIECDVNVTDYNTDAILETYPNFVSIGIGENDNIKYKYNVTEWDNLGKFDIGGKTQLWDFKKETLSDIIVKDGLKIEFNIAPGVNTHRVYIQNPKLFIFFKSDVKYEAESILNKLQVLGLDVKSKLTDLKETELTLTPNTKTLQIGDKLVITALLSDENNNPITNKPIKWYQGTIYKGEIMTDDLGESTFEYDSTHINQGVYNYYALYEGDEEYLTSTSDNVEITAYEYVSKQEPIVLIDILPKTPVISDNAVITGKITDMNNIPIKNLQAYFTIDGTKINSIQTDKDGIVSFKWEVLAKDKGSRAIRIGTDETPLYKASLSNELKVNIDKSEVTITSDKTEDINLNVKNNFILSGTVTNHGGKALNNATVEVHRIHSNSDEVIYTIKTDNTGEYAQTIYCNSQGEYQYYTKVIFSGDDLNYLTTVSSKLNVVVNGVKTKLSLNCVDTAKALQVIDLTANIGVEGLSINFYQDNTMIGQVSSNSDGVAKLSYKLNQTGTLNFTAKFVGDDYYIPSNSETKTIVVSKLPNPLQYTISLKEIIVGQTSTITANGIGAINITGAITVTGENNVTGTFTATKLGDYNITITATGNNIYDSESVNIGITVVEPITPALTIATDKTSYTAGDTAVITTTCDKDVEIKLYQEDTLITSPHKVFRNGLADYTFKAVTTAKGAYQSVTQSITVAKVKETPTIEAILPDKIAYGKTLQTRAYLKSGDEIVKTTDPLTYDFNPTIRPTVDTVLTLTSNKTSASTGETVTLTATLMDINGNPVNGATVVFMEGSSTLYSGITNNLGVITYNYSPSIEGFKSLKCSFDRNTNYNSSVSNVISLEVYYFVDGGVTGNKNINYITTGGTQITTDTAGTKISCSTASYSYYIANKDLSGDFTIELTWISGYWWDLELIIFNTSNNYLNSFQHLHGAGYNHFQTEDSGQISGSLNSNDKLKIIRTGSTFQFYQNNNLILSFINSTNTVRFGFRTHSDAGRYQKYKDLKIY